MEWLSFYNEKWIRTKEKMNNNKKETILFILEILGGLAIVVAVVTFFLEMRHDISDIQTQVGGLTTKVDTMYDDMYLDDGVLDQLGEIRKDFYPTVVNTTNEAMLSTLKSISIKQRDIDYVATPLSAEMELGTDTTGEIRYAKDLINETILITYKEGNNDVYFLGQYNENYHWNGLCITNVYYPNGTLFGICESNFDDGKRLDFKSLCLSASVDDEWVFSERVCKDGKNVGINANYSFDYDKTKSFTNETVMMADIFKVDRFLKNIDYRMTRYYSGNTFDELYNDTTGQAYLVTYYKDGTIKSLCYGNFVDGVFEDSTGDAWDIAYSENDNHYVYNHDGVFKNNRFVRDSGVSDVLVNINQINEIISVFDFDCELNWKLN